LLALAVKISRRVDDDAGAYRWATIFLVLGATLYYLPLTFAVEAASQEHLAPLQNLMSSQQPTIALYIMWASLVGVTLVLLWLFMRTLATANRSMAKRFQAAQAAKTLEAAQVK
jgi:hypothetical protein